MKRSLAAVVCLFLALGVGGSVVAQEVDINARPSITVQGEGKASVAPDSVQITVGVEVQGEQATEALANNSAAMRKLMETLEAQGVPRKNIQTVAFNVMPQYPNDQPRQYGAAEQTTPRIIGYRVINQVRIRLSKIEMLGELLDHVVSAGANSIHGIQFDVEEPGGVLDMARANAITDARRKAELLAKAAGVSVGQPLQISETGFSGPPQPMHRMALMAESSVPIAEGEQQMTVHVTVVYALEPAEESEIAE